MQKLDVRIGELAARTGVNVATLRAWERRHGILRPQRTSGGHRVYDADDLARVRAVLALVQRGVGLRAAVDQLANPSHPRPGDGPEDARLRLWESIDAFDEQRAATSLATATAALGTIALLDEVLVPIFRRLGDEWRLSARNIAREHFTSTLVRSHLTAMLPGDYSNDGQTCLAFCPEREQHDLGLLMAALTLASTGTRVVVLGAQTPSASVDVLLEELRPKVVLVAATSRQVAARFSATWRRRRGTLVVAGGAGFRQSDQAGFSGIVHTGAYGLLPAIVS